MAFGGALFWGRAAESADESLQRWRALWQEDERRNLAEQEAQRNREFQQRQAFNQQAFEERMSQAQQDFQLGLLDRNEAFALGTMAVENQGSWDMEGQRLMREHLKAIDSPFLPMFESGMRRSMFQTPEAANEYLRQVYEAPLGTKLDPWLVEEALNVRVQMQGLDEAAAKELRGAYTSALEQRNEDGATLEDIALQLEQYKVPQAQANLEATQAGTALTQTQTAATAVSMAHAMEEHGWARDAIEREELRFEKEMMVLDRQIHGLGLQNVRDSIINGHLPQQLQAEVGRITAETVLMHDEHAINVATFDDFVREVAARADVRAEEARHAVTVGAFRDALVRGEVSELHTRLRAINQDIEESKSRTELNREGLNFSRQEMLYALLEHGDSSLMGSIGKELLSDMGFDAATVDGIAATWGERMDEGLSTRALLDGAAVDLALADVKVAEGTADARIRTAVSDAEWAEGRGERDERDFAEGVRQFDVGVEQHELDRAEDARQHNERLAESIRATNLQAQLTREGHQIERDRLAMLQASNAPVPATPKSTMQFLDDARGALNIDARLISMSANDAFSATSLDENVELLIQSVEAGQLSEADAIAQAAALLNVDPLDAPSLAVMGEMARTQADTARSLASSNIRGLLKAGLDPVEGIGDLLSMDDLTLDASNPVHVELYNRAVMELGVGREQTAAEIQAKAENPGLQADIQRVHEYAHNLITRIAPQVGGITVTNARAIYDDLVKEFGAELVQDAGLYSPEALLPSNDPQQLTYGDVAREAVQQDSTAGVALRRLGVPDTVNLNSDHASRQQILDGLQASQVAALELAKSVTRLDDLSKRGGFLGLGGRPDATDAHYRAAERMRELAADERFIEGQLQAGVLGQDESGRLYVIKTTEAAAYLNRLAEQRLAEMDAILARASRTSPRDE